MGTVAQEGEAGRQKKVSNTCQNVFTALTSELFNWHKSAEFSKPGQNSTLLPISVLSAISQ
jgi:hypothetical protein